MTRLVLAVVAILSANFSGAHVARTQSPKSRAHTRLYYIAADEIDWDYVPQGKNGITQAPFSGVALDFVSSGPDRIGHVYHKAVYREYTDGTFTTLKPRKPEWEHLGILGPLVRGEVGDTIRIVFRNHGTHPYTMHPHGVFYNKDSEGAGYADNTGGADKADDAVPPGGTHTYVWAIPERAGPAAGDGSSVLWMYHSHVGEEADVNSGLIGPILVTARGMARADGSPKDVDREAIEMFEEFDENTSWFFDENIAKHATKPESVHKSTSSTFADPFYISNLRETINGFSFGNGPMLTFKKGERVRWYIMSSTNFEIHAPHWHGNVVTSMHMRTDVLALLPMGMIVADMVPDNPGIWLFHCHIGPHLNGGMSTRYTVLDNASAAKESMATSMRTHH